MVVMNEFVKQLEMARERYGANPKKRNLSRTSRAILVAIAEAERAGFPMTAAQVQGYVCKIWGDESGARIWRHVIRKPSGKRFRDGFLEA